MSLRRHFAAFILGVPVAELTADNMAEVDAMLQPDEQPALTERKVWGVFETNGAPPAWFHDEATAMRWARKREALVFPLTAVADFTSARERELLALYQGKSTDSHATSARIVADPKAAELHQSVDVVYVDGDVPGGAVMTEEPPTHPVRIVGVVPGDPFTVVWERA